MTHFMRSVAALVVLAPALARASTPAAPRLFSVDYQSLVSRADLHYDTPATRSEEGMPVGNGRMGSLVWTTPNALRFQVNRNDVFATDSRTHSFRRAHTDYAAGVAYVDVQVGDGVTSDVFGGKKFSQHLGVYDGVITAAGEGVRVRAIAWQTRDVFAIEIDDQRKQSSPIHVDLRMLRYANQYAPRGISNDLAQRHEGLVATNAHTALMRLGAREDHRITLTQEFREGEFFNGSAVAIGVVGREAKAGYYNDSTVRLSAAPGAGKFVILVGSAATFDSKADVAAAAVAELDAAGAKGFDGLLADNQTWWRDFWSRAFVRMSSDDGVANEVERNYTYFLYLMAASSRGDYPAHFNGMLWYTNGDMRAWGSAYWWANQSCYYQGLPASNRFELLDPTFELYTRMYDASARAAKEQWGSQGIWIGETSFHNGPEPLPADIAAEMRELYLLKKPWDQRSARFREHELSVYSFTARWNWIAQSGRWELGRWIHEDKGHPPFGHVTHIFGTTAKIAYLYWQKYEHTLDEAWLRDRAYPMMKGAVEFYRNYPNLKKDADGKYHIYHTNSNEPAWGVKDSDEDMSAMRGMTGALIHASEILKLDEDLRPVWQEFLENLAPIPTTDTPDALIPADYNGPRTWVKGLKPAVKPGGTRPDGNTLPMWNFDLCHVETTDAEMLKLANSTLDAYLRQPLGPETLVGTLSRVPIAAAQLGRAEAVRYMLPAQLRASDASRNDAPGVFRNRMSLREGPGALDAERLGRVAEALQTALLHSAPPMPGCEPIIRVFPAWPKEWDADFTLLARGAFLVSASVEKGVVKAVEIESKAGGECRLRNPWGANAKITVYRNGERRETIEGSLLRIPTTRGEIVTVVPENAQRPQRKVA